MLGFNITFLVQLNGMPLSVTTMPDKLREASMLHTWWKNGIWDSKRTNSHLTTEGSTLSMVICGILSILLLADIHKFIIRAVIKTICSLIRFDTLAVLAICKIWIKLLTIKHKSWRLKCHRGLSPGDGVVIIRLARLTTTPISVQWVQSAGCKHNS